MRFGAKLLLIMLLIACPAVVCAFQTPGPRFSPDGAIVATPEEDCTVSLWDVASGKKIATLHGNEPPWLAFQRFCDVVLSFSPNGKLLATQRAFGPVTLWDAQTGRKLATLGGTGDEGVSLTFSRDSRLLLALIKAEAGGHKVARTNGISVWDVAAHKELLRVREDQKNEFREVVLSPDGKTVVALVGSERGTKPLFGNARYITDTIKLWDVEMGRELVALKGQSTEFSPDGKSLLVKDSGRQTVWDIRAGGISTAQQPVASSRAMDLTFAADNVAKSIGDNKWNWTVFVKGDKQDIDNIKCVEYKLHPTFPNPVRRVCEPGDPQLPFGLSATGWGTFSIGIRVFMKDGTHQDLKHQLKF